MASVGDYLRDLRDRRGISLEEISRVTRVASGYLEALESDRFSALPPPVFTRGFIRAYCQALGESPDEALARYDGREGGAPPPPRPTAPAGTTPAAKGEPPSRSAVLVSFVLLVILGMALFAVALMTQPAREDRVERRMPSASERAASPYRLVARVSEPTWIRVRTEDGSSTEETVPAGQIREWVSNRPFVLTLGNAGGVTLELNGRTLPPLGPSGTVISRIVLPPQ